MDKLSKSQFGLISKHELWNKIKTLEKQVESLQLTVTCNEGTFQDLCLETTELNKKVQFLIHENHKLRSHNDYLLSQLSGYSPKTINFN